MLKEAILQKSFTSHLPDENEFKELLKRTVTYIDDAADLPVAAVAYLDQAYNVQGVTFVCEEISAGVYDWVTYNTSGQSLDYNNASHKPTIDGITLNGALTKEGLEIAPSSAARTVEVDPNGYKIPLNDDKYIVYEDLMAFLSSDFGISTLPKYEKYNNPLLTTTGGVVLWVLSHTCKTNYPIIQFYDKNGELQDSNNLSGLKIANRMNGTISIEFDSVSNVPANEYYVVLIG
jgi:hypothetical protein